MTTATRQEVLGLYRRIFRLARAWQAASGQAQDTAEERRYIVHEARTLFRKNKNVSSPAGGGEESSLLCVRLCPVLKRGGLSRHRGSAWAGRAEAQPGPPWGAGEPSSGLCTGCGSWSRWQVSPHPEETPSQGESGQ